MNKSIRWWGTAFVAVSTLVLVSTSAVVAFQVRPKTSRFDAKVIEDPTMSIDVVTTGMSDLPATDSVRRGWDRFRVNNGSWTVHLDRRSGAPLLVEGQGLRFPVAPGATVESIGTGLRSFIAANKALLKAEDDELVIDHEASGKLTPDVWQVVFSRRIAGVPVTGERYVFTVGHGNLIAFGTPRWSRIDVNPFPTIEASEALGKLKSHMGVGPADSFEMVEKGSLQIIPLRAISTTGGPYKGPLGEGYSSALVWRVVVRVDGEIGTWAALVDAHTGEIRSFNDINDYAQTKGGVYPVSNDQIPPDGVEQANWPMPFANVTINAVTQSSTSTGLFNCTPGGATATMNPLQGPFVRVVDTCGAVNATVSCDADINLGASAGTDCVTPGFGGAGNTHASRSGFYHLNRIAEHGRYWLPTRPWLTQQLTDNVNLNQTCNAYWNGTSVNFFKSGGGCRNTGEIAGIFLHEWGHGMDSNDGGGVDRPGEAYADIVAMVSTHVSCIGRGFDLTSNCTGYGDTCLSCTGIRDQDWDKRQAHTPATPSGFATTFCPTGGTTGPCGREGHCEAYVSAETIWDLATRDLPASGLDLASAWQLVDKLWYKSRLGSGGNFYNCSLPNSDGCGAATLYTKFRTIDDDDGNLANGTPHAAAIFAAFNRHKIACGLVGDASNQSTSACPAIAAPLLTSIAGSGSAVLNWGSVANAVSYSILRNDASCDAGSTIVASVAAPTTTYTDTGLANGFTEYYRVQAVGSNPACEGLLSNCAAVTPQPFSGVVKFDRATYSCSGLINVTVTDGNIPGSTATVSITSGTEPGGETITVTQVGGSADYVGSITTTTAPASADGAISVVAGDTITGTYIDADDGVGGVNIPRQTTAAVDCVVPIITNVQSTLVTGSGARITWDTNEAASSTVRYGVTPGPPGSSATVAAPVTSHVVDIAGLIPCTTYVFSVESTDVVGNTAFDNAGGLYYSFTTGADVAQDFTYSGPPVPIPDNNATGASATINIPNSEIVSDVNVKINVTHTYVGDLIISLIPPAGSPITLYNRLPNSELNNFTNTVFDDSAATSITAGTPPFTGTFRPSSPLSAANGINSAGNWTLKVVDAAGIDVGTIDNWTLTLVYPVTCGPHAEFEVLSPGADDCTAGGPGDGNTYWDAGEQVQFTVSVKNDGTTPLTGITATVSSTTPGVVMIDDTASYADLAPGASGGAQSPFFTAYLPTSLACGSTVAFQVAIATDQGSWGGGSSAPQPIGHVIPGGGTALNETFAAGIPATWTIVDGGVLGNPAAATWTAANPGGRTFTSPLVAPVAIVDSDNAGAATATQDEQMITHVLNLSTATSVTLQFDQYFRWYNLGGDEVANVDVRSSATGGLWVNVLHQEDASSPNPDHKTVNITAQAAGAADVQIRFHYFNGDFDWWWMLDNVKVDFVAPGGCDMPVCASAPGVAKPVADGSFGVPMTGTRSDVSGTTIGLAWDVATCSSTDHHVLYGNLEDVSLSIVDGAYCNLGTSGSSSWTGVPAGNLWFVVVGDDDSSKEGSWGMMTSGERGGASASGQCGMTNRDNAATCP